MIEQAIEYIVAKSPAVASEFWNALVQMSPYLIFGFLFAGVLSVLISPRTVERHLGGAGFWPVIKAAAFGVPLPLCSCGVIPVAAALRKNGASKGATTAFLLSTPQTGVDSIAATFSMLGPAVAIYRPLAALVSGMLGGWAVDLLDRKETPAATNNSPDDQTAPMPQPKTVSQKIVAAIHYGLVDLPADIGKALLVGLTISALIAALLPDNYFANVLPPGIGQMIVLMLMGIPIYVCATASIPIAAALIVAGASPGAAFAFLVTGPATNAAAIATMWKILGRRSTIIYMATVIVSALAGGLILDAIIDRQAIMQHVHHSQDLPEWVGNVAAIAMISMLLATPIKKLFLRKDKCCKGKCKNPANQTIQFSITGMTCEKCVAHVKQAIESCNGVQHAEINLTEAAATITGNGMNSDDIIAAVEKAGYTANPTFDAQH